MNTFRNGDKAYTVGDIDKMEARIKELEQDRKDLIEEFAEADCMGDLAKTARNHGYEG